MGKKINPLGFRLETNQDHYSLWFEQAKNYSQGLQEDKKIRDSIKYVQKNMNISSSGIGMAHIKIQKRIDLIQVNIYMGLTTKFLVIEGSQLRIIDNFEMTVKKELSYVNRKLNIAITRITKPYGDPNILAAFIAEQLKNRVSFRKAMKKAIELTEQQAGTNKGIQIQIAGRMDGKEIARVEWIREGKVPLQSIRAKINYGSYPIRTLYGLLGIKIWIFTEEE